MSEKSGNGCESSQPSPTQKIISADEGNRHAGGNVVDFTKRVAEAILDFDEQLHNDLYFRRIIAMDLRGYLSFAEQRTFLIAFVEAIKGKASYEYLQAIVKTYEEQEAMAETFAKHRDQMSLPHGFPNDR